MPPSMVDVPGGSGYALDFMRPQRFGRPCNTCDNFDLYSFGRDPFGFRGYKYCDAEDAAARGCGFCSILVTAFKDKLRNVVQSPPAGWEKRWWIHLHLPSDSQQPQDVESGGTGLGVSVMRATLAFENYTLPGWLPPKRRSKGPFPSVDFHMSADPDSPAAISGDISGRYSGDDVLADDYIRMIYTWLQNCLLHPECCKTLSGERSFNSRQVSLPTRCVEVLSGGFRLKETGSEEGAYITLSHRWAPETALCCTTTENITSRANAQDTWSQDLPKMFLDVIDLARRLRIKYVWIDSLCIIQKGDDGADWQQEALRMADYYQYSLLTIVATSTSKDLGLIPQQIISQPQIARLPYRDSAACRRGYFYAYSYNWEVYRQYQSFIQHSELLSRGWVFQERLLSRRSVYFTPMGTFFECQSEVPHNHRGEVTQPRSDGDVPAPVVQAAAKNSFTLDGATIHPMWYRIIESYSVLSLTKPETDRIVALAGVAKEFREALTRTALGESPVVSTVPSGLEYVSGLWLPDLHGGLLWERNSSSREIQRISKFPTWSWTSVLCPVVWDDGPRRPIKPEAKLVAVTSSQADVFSVESLRPIGDRESSTPRVFDVDNQFASLCMRGKILQVLVRHKFRNEADLKIASATSGHSANSDKNAWRAVFSSLLPTAVAGWASFEHPEYQDDALFEEGLELCVFHISTASRIPGGYGLGYLTPWHHVYNVLFVRNINGQKYERLGVGKLFGKEIDQQCGAAKAQYIELN